MSRRKSELSLAVPFAYFDIMDVNAACLLAQIRYWHEHALHNDNVGVWRDGYKWVYNTHDDWAAQMHWTTRLFRTALDKLVKRGIVVRARYRATIGGERKVATHLRPDYDVLQSLLDETQNDEVRQARTPQFDANSQIPEIDANRQTQYTEITTDTTIHTTPDASCISPDASEDEKQPPSKSGKNEDTSDSNDVFRSLFSAVQEHVFGSDHQGWEVGGIASWLAGKTDRVRNGGAKEPVGYISAPARPEHVARFVRWYRQQYDGAALPYMPYKFVRHWRTFAAQQQRREQHTTLPVDAESGDEPDSGNTPAPTPRLTPAERAAVKLRQAPDMMSRADWDAIQAQPDALTDEERKEHNINTEIGA